MKHTALAAGQPFPQLAVKSVEGGELTLGTPGSGFDWQLIVVYRGAHCPLCTRYLKQLNTLLSEFHRLKIEVLAVSADPLDRAQQQLADIQPTYPVGYGLSIEQMQELGVYISQPRSAQEAPAPFAEPALFVMNDKQELQLVDISNAPFTRPDLTALLGGLGFIRKPENNYPIRGTFK
ncbi:redoxin domain-containing protein [Pseudovibrio brasiliensis]|uniref:Redoxin domain-containing protein n=1 Tax=Pseudovibrio brasiliensis TaxID=1898042 RepID=A0ABX8ATR6_9HYPH|nr:redoxin domain-containing protein [Pseudovibrio brasiliensis]QUS58505.1 redoxin domain-containing protein [Pseudovibrio brasiliensis]